MRDGGHQVQAGAPLLAVLLPARDQARLLPLLAKKAEPSILSCSRLRAGSIWGVDWGRFDKLKSAQLQYVLNIVMQQSFNHYVCMKGLYLHVATVSCNETSAS